MPEEYVSQKFCDERSKRVIAETKAVIIPLEAEVRLMCKKLDNFGKEIAKHAVNAKSGQVEIKPPLKDRMLLYASVVASIVLVVREILSFLGGLT